MYPDGVAVNPIHAHACLQVFPGEYGIPLKPWFFVLPSYWFPDRTVYGNLDVIFLCIS